MIAPRTAKLSAISSRWWSSFELIYFILFHANEITCFIKSYRSRGSSKMPESMRVLEEITESRDQQALIFVEMATVYDVFRPLVSATHNLEGDGPLAIFAFDEVMLCDTHLHQLANLAIEDDSIAPNIIATCNMACYEWKVLLRVPEGPSRRLLHGFNTRRCCGGIH